jgi:cytochrome c-type biogenesis protein CcmH
MIAFWLSCSALAVMALALLLRPLLRRKPAQDVSREAANVSIYRDQLREIDADLAAGTLVQADYDRSRREIEARLAEDMRQGDAAAAPAVHEGRRTGIAAAIAVPLCAVAIYFAVGAPGALAPRDGEHINAMVERLAAHLRENPDDADGWRLLGRSYLVMRRYDEAVKAYAQAAARFPRDAQLLADFADALAMARGQSLEGEPEQLILRALEIEPDNLKALALAGTVAFDRKDYAAAAKFWQRMVPQVPADTEDGRIVRGNVEEALRLAGEKPAAAAGGVSGSVSIAPQLKKQAAPDDTVFIFARAVEGPPMPLAVKRVKAKDLPASFALDDSMAMAPGLALSKFPKVVITARVSRSGKPVASPGDLQGASGAVPNDAKNVRIVIDAVVK